MKVGIKQSDAEKKEDSLANQSLFVHEKDKQIGKQRGRNRQIGKQVKRERERRWICCSSTSPFRFQERDLAVPNRIDKHNGCSVRIVRLHREPTNSWHGELCLGKHNVAISLGKKVERCYARNLFHRGTRGTRFANGKYISSDGRVDVGVHFTILQTRRLYSYEYLQEVTAGLPAFTISLFPLQCNTIAMLLLLYPFPFLHNDRSENVRFMHGSRSLND